MITMLMTILMLMSLLQPNAPRLFAAVAFTCVTVLPEQLLSAYTGLGYYGSAALFDLGIITLTSWINPVPRMVISLHKICMVSILLNAVGWVLWTLYYPPLVYDMSYIALYAWTLFVFTRRGDRDVGGFTLDSWRACFRFDIGTWRSYHAKYGGPT